MYCEEVSGVDGVLVNLDALGEDDVVDDSCDEHGVLVMWVGVIVWVVVVVHGCVVVGCTLFCHWSANSLLFWIQSGTVFSNVSPFFIQHAMMSPLVVLRFRM